jgi:hypothetical protein
MTPLDYLLNMGMLSLPRTASARLSAQRERQVRITPRCTRLTFISAYLTLNELYFLPITSRSRSQIFSLVILIVAFGKCTSRLLAKAFSWIFQPPPAFRISM